MAFPETLFITEEDDILYTHMERDDAAESAAEFTPDSVGEFAEYQLVKVKRMKQVTSLVDVTDEVKVEGQ